MNGNGKRKLYFATGIGALLGLLALMGAVPGFAYLQSFVGEIVKAVIYLAAMFMAGNVGEHVAPHLSALFGKRSEK